MVAQAIHQDHDFQGSGTVTGLRSATADSDAATYGQLKGAIEQLAWKDNVRAGSANANVNLAAPGATIGGVSMAAGDGFVARNQTAGSENGIYVWNGASVAATRRADANTWDELKNAVVPVDEGTDAGTYWRQSTVSGTLGTTAIVWSSFNAGAPAASEGTAGIAAFATQAEVDAGSVTNKTLTPATLAAYAGRKRKFGTVIGDGTATSFNIDHNFGTRDVIVQVYRTASPYDRVDINESRPTTNRVTIAANAALASNQLTVVILA